MTRDWILTLLVIAPQFLAAAIVVLALAWKWIGKGTDKADSR